MSPPASRSNRDLIPEILPRTNTKALDRIVAEQDAYYGRPVDTAKMIFVFGSNEAGIHGAGAAAYALKYRGAVWGEGIGLHGQSYALPTKNGRARSLVTLPMEAIQVYVEQFLEFAGAHPGFIFQVTCIGCGLAGLEHRQIAPMFVKAPKNCLFDTAWRPWLGPDKEYWGTF